jgi:hypothetical protein
MIEGSGGLPRWLMMQECQLKGWKEGGHKGDCKIIKAIRAIWP